MSQYEKHFLSKILELLVFLLFLLFFHLFVIFYLFFFCPKSPDFWISGQLLIKENFRNSRTSNDIDIKFGPVTKPDKRNKKTSKKLTMTSCRQIVTSLLFVRFMAKFRALRKPDFRLIVCMTYIFINSNFLSYKN